MMKKFIAAIAALGIMGGLCGCTVTSSSYNAMTDYDFTEINLVQLEDPEDGDTIAIFDTDMGEFRAVLYDEYCPNTVANFVEHAKAGDYDGLSVFAVLTDTYFLTGGHEDEDTVYTGRDDDSEVVELECNVNLWPFKGALVTYSELPGYSDARYIVCNTDSTMTQEQIDELKESLAENEDRSDVEKQNLSDLFDKFLEVGGVFGMAGSVTVFGQTYEGMEVVEKICALQSDENNNYQPLETVMINSVTISEYNSADYANEEG